MLRIGSAARSLLGLAFLFLTVSACLSGEHRSSTFSVPAPGPKEYPAPAEGDFVVSNFHFRTGETLPEMKIHYRTFGTLLRDGSGRATNAVLLLHGTTGAGKQLLTPSFAKYLFGAGQPLDVTRYFVIVPDQIGHGASSKPSDGLRAHFPHYGYQDMVNATHDLLTTKLGVNHLRLVMGFSMGGSQTWMWGESYPNFTDALMPLASNPIEIGGANRIWRKAIIDAIRSDPDWAGGDYKSQPMKALTTVADITMLAPKNAPVYLEHIAPTGPAADDYFEHQVSEQIATMDANDLLFAFEASADYNPEADLPKITAAMVAVNSADDYLNPPSLGIIDRDIKRVKNGRFVLVPASDRTRGHFTGLQAEFWSNEVADLLSQSGGH
ncbi:alpha/beta fold hydrolase [Mycobacterium saskatchewanense]|uniref:AB hydrolase-1 domain-containing protein n=1 Tax=Mycobacterium saskatchewanense TaxID=220927 RepID=A0AAJ3NS19_9MYCO|nr:alpha/beta fold hydrolase [Mycobacterium saskatchewanense]ORW72851.1 hypothetical protein AWC23_08280 [Mycobacterium saskatchewanense]